MTLEFIPMQNHEGSATREKYQQKKPPNLWAVLWKLYQLVYWVYLNLLGDFLSHSMMMGLATNIEE